MPLASTRSNNGATASVGSLQNCCTKDKCSSASAEPCPVTGLVLSSFYMLYDSFQKNNLTLIFSYSPWLYSLFLLISFADIVTIYSGIKSSQCGNLGFIGLIQYVTVFYGFLFDVTIFRDELRAMDVLVSVVILATTMAVSIYKINQEKKQL